MIGRWWLQCVYVIRRRCCSRKELRSECLCTVLFFFFQAEDGIRDYKVTGVQTCALPIFLLEDPGQGPHQRLIVVGDEDLGSGLWHLGCQSSSSEGSTLPPLTTSTVGGTGWTAPERTAAVVAAPDGSTARWQCCQRKCTASRSVSSSTSATPATRSRCAASCANGSSPTPSVIRPSAMLAVRSSRTGRPAASERLSFGAPAGSTPPTLAPLPPAPSPGTTPAMRPPPPTGTSTVP